MRSFDLRQRKGALPLFGGDYLQLNGILPVKQNTFTHRLQLSMESDCI